MEYFMGPGWSIRGKSALLTGAGGGIGSAIALKLADEGCNLVLSDRDAASLERTQAACAQRGGFALRILTVVADLSNRSDIARLAKEAATAFGAPLDFLINNAGVMDASDFASQSVESIERMVAVNLTAPMLLTRLLLPGMIARRQGIIITVSSICGFLSTPKCGVYGAAKAGLNNWTLSLRAELAGTGVACASVCPGFVTGAGMYADMLRDFQRTKAPVHISRLHWLWEVPAWGVAHMVVGQIKGGALFGLMPAIAVMPMRLLGFMQAMAPDWFTAWLLSRWMPGDPFFTVRAMKAAAKREE